MGSYIRFDQAKKRLLRKVVKWGIKDILDKWQSIQ